jgi:hypothetical protein
MKSSGLVWERSRAGKLWLAAMVMGALLLATSLRADETGQGTRAVRLGNVDGQVRVSQGGQVLADPALANMPLFEGTQVATGDDGRAEIQLEDGSVARISPNSALTLSVVRGQDGSTETEMVLEGGLGYFEGQPGSSTSQFRIRFGDSVATMSGFTVLRINLDTPPGQLAVFSGNAHVERGSAMAVDLHGGESVSLDSSEASRYNLSESVEPDSWDAWNADRDQALQAEFGAQTGATKSQPDSNNPAWADLDANGNWYNVPGQGYIWSPSEASAADWDPYGNGSWSWTPGFGYIWVSGAPWGYLPYQCGAWNYFDEFGWGWAPGRCRPWWGVGGWMSNIGYGPNGYRPPRRPNPVLPRRIVSSGNNTKAALLAHPVVPVSRRLSGLVGELPARERNVPVVIAGHAVRPVAPEAARPVYNGGLSSGAGNRSQPVYAGGSKVPAVAPPAAGLRSTTPAPKPAIGASQHPTPASPASSGSSSSHSSSGASHASSSSSGSSFGGGGGGHGGGGGGGGGGHH